MLKNATTTTNKQKQQSNSIAHANLEWYRIIQARHGPHSQLAVFGLFVCSAVLGKNYLQKEQIFAELIFAILAINRENKFRDAYKVLDNRENLSPKI